MPKKTFNRKPQQVEAIQLLLDNLDEVKAFVAEKPTPTVYQFSVTYPLASGAPGLELHNGYNKTPVYAGDYVYRLSTGDIFACREELFFQLYE